LSHPSLLDCQNVIWAFRNMVVRNALMTDGETETETAAAITPSEANRPVLVYSSRKGDKSRDILNEEALLQYIRQRIPSVTITPIKFGNVSRREQMLLLVKGTVFLGMDGTADMHTIFMRPNSARVVITVDTPSIYPYHVFAPWQHQSEAHIARRKGTNRFGGNYLLTQGEMESIASLVERAVARQVSTPSVPVLGARSGDDAGECSLTLDTPPSSTCWVPACLK